QPETEQRFDDDAQHDVFGRGRERGGEGRVLNDCEVVVQSRKPEVKAVAKLTDARDEPVDERADAYRRQRDGGGGEPNVAAGGERSSTARQHLEVAALLLQ